MRSDNYFLGTIDTVRRHKRTGQVEYFFVTLDDGARIFVHVERHHKFEVLPNGDVVFNPTPRTHRRTRQVLWDIKIPEPEDRIICHVMPAITPGLSNYAGYWGYYHEWLELWQATADQRPPENLGTFMFVDHREDEQIYPSRGFLEEEHPTR